MVPATQEASMHCIILRAAAGARAEWVLEITDLGSTLSLARSWLHGLGRSLDLPHLLPRDGALIYSDRKHTFHTGFPAGPLPMG